MLRIILKTESGVEDLDLISLLQAIQLARGEVLLLCRTEKTKTHTFFVVTIEGATFTELKEANKNLDISLL